MKRRHRVTLTLFGAMLGLLLMAAPALAAPAVDGWGMSSLAEDVGSSVQARVSGDRIVWAVSDGAQAGKIMVCDIASAKTTILETGPQATSPEIDDDHVAYFSGAQSSVFLYSLSTGENKQLTEGSRLRYDLKLRGNLLVWREATRSGIEGPAPGDISLLAYDLTKDKITTLAVGGQNVGPTGFVASADWVVWNMGAEGAHKETWAYSRATGEKRELASLRGSRVMAISGGLVLVLRSRDAFSGSSGELWVYDLSSGKERLVDKLSAVHESVQADGDLVAWASYGEGSTYVALFNLARGELLHIPTTGYDIGGLVLRGGTLIWHAQFGARFAGTTWNYLFAYDYAKTKTTRLATLFGSNDAYDTDGDHIVFPTGNSWPYDQDKPLELLLAARTASSTRAFLDVHGVSANRTAVEGLKERGIVEGYDVGTGPYYRPDARLTRAQFAKMLALALDLTVAVDATSPFEDIGPGTFPGAYVSALVDRGIVAGTSARRFSPDANITRAQLMTMLVRGIDRVKPGVLGTPPTTTWPDYRGTVGPFDPTHGPFLLRAEVNGLVDGLFGYGPKWDPWRLATRGEAAQAVWNFLAKGGQLAPAS